MLKFDISQMRSVYVYILKVTTDYVYVTTTRSGAPYKANSSLQGEHNGRNVSKIKIHRSVSHNYSAIYLTREFSTPWLTSLNYYGDEVISIEIQRVNRFAANGFQDPNNWQSSFSKAIILLADEIKNEKSVYVNGTEIFWPEKVKEDIDDSELNMHNSQNRFHFTSRTETSLDKDGYFTIRNVNFIKLATMGVGLSSASVAKEEVKIRQSIETGLDAPITIRHSVRLGTRKGKVLTYYPNALSPTEEQIHVFSPVLQSKALNAVNAKTKKKDEESLVYFLASSRNKAYANVNFAIKAAQTIGRLYGYEHTDDLDIQGIIEETGEVNLMNIDEASRKILPIKMDAMTSIAYLFRFIYKEQKLRNLRDLSTMFRFCINSGLVYEKDISTDFIGNVSEIPLVKLSSVDHVKELFSTH
ncbi:hypothetical protein [Psychromonas sp. SP041]|uniref:hypothetical protein n=1 Tax=Psychromonas sp. SP041 TaxID=1365007 RepID=UPI0010C79D73|nr:hypothetical protein [Psychromonas sp. SP041]